MDTTLVAGQPSWKISSDRVEAWLTETGGHLGPISFDLHGRTIQPYNLAPWAEEPFDPELPPILRVLRGDFFCMPFGGNSTPFSGEHHPAHGDTANSRWSLEDVHEEAGSTTLHASLATQTRNGRVDKYVTLRQGEQVVYQRHVVSRMSGVMTFGHHAMLRFPDREGSGLVSTSPFVIGRTAPEPVELPSNRGYSILKPDTSFDSLDRVETVTGEIADLSRYPARRGFEDLVMLVNDPERRLAWTAVSFPDDGYVWFALKDATVLRQTIFWISNMGRYYPPWNGRHLNVMGLEEVTSYFHYGLAESAVENPISVAGHPTSVRLREVEELDVRYVMGVAAVQPGFGRVEDIAPGAGGVSIRGSSGTSIEVPMNVAFLKLGQI